MHQPLLNPPNVAHYLSACKRIDTQHTRTQLCLCLPYISEHSALIFIFFSLSPPVFPPELGFQRELSQPLRRAPGFTKTSPNKGARIWEKCLSTNKITEAP